MRFGCFRSCCCTLLCGHSWEEQEFPQSWMELENVRRWEGRAWFGKVFVEFSATRKGPEMSHHQKQLLFSSVSHQASALWSHIHVTPFQPFFIACCILNLPFAGLMGRARGGSSTSVVSAPPKLSASCLLSSPDPALCFPSPF